MILWSFQWILTLNGILTIIYLCAALSDFIPFVSAQSMFSWTPMIKEGKKLITARVEYNVQERNPFLYPVLGPLHVPIMPNERPVLLKMKDSRRLINEYKEQQKFRRNNQSQSIQKNSGKNLFWAQRRTGIEKLIPYTSKNKENVQIKDRKDRPEFFQDTDVSGAKTNTYKNNDTDNSNTPSLRHDNSSYLPWKNVQNQSDTKQALSFNLSLPKSRNNKKKNVRLKKVKTKNISTLSVNINKDGKEKIDTFSAKLYPGSKDDINQVQNSTTSRFFGTVMIDSKIAINSMEENKNQPERKERKGKR